MHLDRCLWLLCGRPVFQCSRASRRGCTGTESGVDPDTPNPSFSALERAVGGAPCNTEIYIRPVPVSFSALERAVGGAPLPSPEGWIHTRAFQCSRASRRGCTFLSPPFRKHCPPFQCSRASRRGCTKPCSPKSPLKPSTFSALERAVGGAPPFQPLRPASQPSLSVLSSEP